VTFEALVIVILIALIFDVINGFHDAANSIATVVSTQVLSPRIAVVWAAFFNFAAMLVFEPKVAETISKIIIIDPKDPHFAWVIFSGLLGAIVWDLLTWRLGLPTSSSHALIGGLAGAAVAYGGFGSLQYGLLALTAAFIFISPIIGLALGFLIMLANIWLFRKKSPLNVDRFFRRGQLISAALYSLGHGANDAQKTMGVIVALLIASGYFSPDTKLSLFDFKTNWIIFLCHLAMAFGTLIGGWRIVKTMGMRITRLKPVGGFSAETAGSISLFLATWLGVPVSTTHTITASIMGVGAVVTKFSNLKWGIAGRIMWAWVLTIPASAIVGAIALWFVKYFSPL
jgi:PiT family inorganic phosphate transporter